MIILLIPPGEVISRSRATFFGLSPLRLGLAVRRVDIARVIEGVMCRFKPDIVSERESGERRFRSSPQPGEQHDYPNEACDQPKPEETARHRLWHLLRRKQRRDEPRPGSKNPRGLR